MMTTKTNQKNLRIRSFGRISTHMTATEQQALEDRLSPFLIKAKNSIKASDLASNKHPITLEIGAGSGELIVNRASKEPNRNFIVNEVFKNGLKSIVVGIENSGVANLKICADDGRELLEQLPENSVDELIVLYPDPWPKKRHNKRRIINEEFLNLANKVLKESPESSLFIATDIPDYAMWMIREIYSHGIFFPTATSPKQWSTPPKWWYSTKYEQKAIQAGRHPWYMTFKRNVDRSNTKCERLKIG